MVAEGGFLLLTKERFCGIINIDKKYGVDIMSRSYFGKAFKDEQGRIFIEEEKKIEVLWKIPLLLANTKVELKERDVYQCPQCNHFIVLDIDTRYLNGSAEDRIIRYGYNYCYRCGHQNIIERD